jgi:hypothetical protein
MALYKINKIVLPAFRFYMVINQYTLIGIYQYTGIILYFFPCYLSVWAPLLKRTPCQKQA